MNECVAPFERVYGEYVSPWLSGWSFCIPIRHKERCCMVVCFNLSVTLCAPHTGSTIKTIQCVTSEWASAFSLALTHAPPPPSTHPRTHSLTYPTLAFTHWPTHLTTHSRIQPPLTSTRTHTYIHTDDGVQPDSVHVRQRMCDALCGCIHGIWQPWWGRAMRLCQCLNASMSVCVCICL